MYEKFYGFKTKPFDLLPDPRFLYLSKKHDLAYAHLEYGITDNKALIVLTGDVGTGKTTLINYFLKKVDGVVNTALVYNTNLDPDTFLQMVAKDFGIKLAGSGRSSLYDGLYEFFLNEHTQRRRCVLVVDEAQNMPRETLEELRMLSNFETEESYLLQIIMVGQPELKERLNDPSLAQLTQRVSVFYELAPLDEAETRQYMEHRLEISGYTGTDSLFTDEAIKRIHAYTKGVPRLISSVSDNALVYGYADSLKTIDVETVDKVIRDRPISPGISTANVAKAVLTTTKTQGNVSQEVRLQMASVHEHLTSLARRLSTLEDVENRHTISELFASLKETQQENRQLHSRCDALLHRNKMIVQKYNTLLHRYQMVLESSKPKETRPSEPLAPQGPSPEAIVRLVGAFIAGKTNGGGTSTIG